MTIVLLTGVGREGQVGEAVARRLSSDGHELILVDRTAAEVNARAATIEASGGSAHPFSADLSDPPSIESLFAEIRARHGDRLSALVHVAGGFGVTGKVADTAIDAWDHQLSINLRTAFLVSRAAIPFLRGAGGSIVFFSSESVISGTRLSSISAYAVAKTGLLTLSSCIAQEERQSGIRSNTIAPESIRTATNEASMAPGSRFVEREDVAATVSWLCSDASAAVTGQVLRLSSRK